MLLQKNHIQNDIPLRIQRLLRKYDGLTISDVARKLDIHYTTASKYLAVLEAEKKIVRRDVGMAKLFRVVATGYDKRS